MNSFAHKWPIENFSSFKDEYVKPKVYSSKNVSNSFLHNNLNNNQQESNKALNNQRFIYSPNFGSKTDGKCNIYLELCPDGFDENSEHFLSIFINLRSFRDDDLRVKYKVSILNSQNGQSNFFKENEGNLEKSARFGWEQFIWLKGLDDRISNDTLTIYCEVDLLNKLSSSIRLNPILKPNVPKLPESVFNVKSKKIEKLFAHQWTIENINSLFLNSKSKPRLNSQRFPDALNNSKFSLCLYPRGLDEEKDEHLLVYFNVDTNSNSNTKEFAYFRVSLLDSSTMNKLCCRGAPIKIRNFNPNNTTWGWHLIKREELLNRTNKFVLKNRLTIYCEVWLPENRSMSLPPGPSLRPSISQTVAWPIPQESQTNSVYRKIGPLFQSQSQSLQMTHQKKPIYRQTPNDPEFGQHKLVNKPESMNQNDPNKPKNKLPRSFEEEKRKEKYSSSITSFSVVSLHSNQSNSNEKSKQSKKSNAEQEQESGPSLLQTFARPIPQESQPNSVYRKTGPLSQSQSQLPQICNQKTNFTTIDANFKYQKKPINKLTPNVPEVDQHKLANKQESKNQNDSNKSKNELPKPIEAKDASNIKKQVSNLSDNANQSDCNEKSKQENKSDVKQKQEPSINYQYTVNNINNSVVANGSNITSGDIGISSLTQMPVTEKSEAKAYTKPENIRANAQATTSVPKTLTNLTAEITWKIPKFLDCKKLGGKEVYSNDFWPPNYPNIKFHLQLCPNGLGVGKDTHVSFRLFLHKCDLKEIRVKAILSVIKTPDEGVKPSPKTQISQNLSEGQSVDWETYAKCKLIMNWKYGFLPDDILTMHCKVEVSDIWVSSEDM